MNHLQLIESKNNSLYKHIKKLKEKKSRIQNQQFIIEGFRFVEEALKSGYEMIYLILNEEHYKKYAEFLDKYKLLESQNTYVFNNNLFNDISCTETPQGILAICKIPEKNLNVVDGFYVLVDKVQDPGNLGTIIRSAHASGAKGIITTKGTVDLYNEKTLRATMGSVFYLPIIEDNNEEFIYTLKNKGYRFLVSSLEAENNFFNVDLKGNIVLCVGNEGSGISKNIEDLSDIKVKIPMPGGAESLNVSVASSIMMFEVVRQNLS